MGSDENGISREDIIRAVVMRNESSIIYVGKVKDRNDFSMNFESGVWTVKNYKVPLHYEGIDYSGMSVVTFIVDGCTAQTNVWGRPVGQNCLGERKLEKLCKTHKISELPSVHEKTVELIEKVYWNMHAERIDRDIKMELEKINDYRDIPF